MGKVTKINSKKKSEFTKAQLGVKTQMEQAGNLAAKRLGTAKIPARVTILQNPENPNQAAVQIETLPAYHAREYDFSKDAKPDAERPRDVADKLVDLVLNQYRKQAKALEETKNELN